MLSSIIHIKSIKRNKKEMHSIAIFLMMLYIFEVKMLKLDFVLMKKEAVKSNFMRNSINLHSIQQGHPRIIVS